MKGRLSIKNKINRAVLFINPEKKHALALGDNIRKVLSKKNIETEVYDFKNNQPLLVKNKYDMAISLGGDGTVLSAARSMAPLGVPVFPVNLGTFGFIAGIKPDEWQEVFDLYTEGKTLISKRLMLEVKVKRNGRDIFKKACLNEVLISSSEIRKIISLNVSLLENRQKKPMDFGSYRADGLIISTPTGSTAHSLAAGGPILDPELDAILLNPICPFALHSRPVVLSGSETIIVDIDKEKANGVIITLDGHPGMELLNDDILYIKKASYKCLLIASGKEGFYNTLAAKFVQAMGKKD